MNNVANFNCGIDKDYFRSVGTGIAQDQKFVSTLICSDYLLVTRARGAQLIRSTSELTSIHWGNVACGRELACQSMLYGGKFISIS